MLTRDRSPRVWTPAALGLGLGLVVTLSGCGEGEQRITKPGQTVAAPKPPAPYVQPREVIGKKTTDIKDAATELKGGDAQVSSGRITAKDPITIQGNAYVSIVGRASQMQIEHTLNLYYAQNEKYPATLEEFMNEVIKPNGIALPQLPAYQEYAYDSANHKLVVLEYPDRKAALLKQMDDKMRP
jgi:hypothetical protein